MKEAGVGAIEWPGGCAANNFNWEANKNPSNTMGVDRFMDFVTEIGAEPVLVGRPSSQYAASNRAWVEYVNNNPDHPEWAQVLQDRQRGVGMRRQPRPRRRRGGDLRGVVQRRL
jgi:alpha-L-arabinofuranosidase